MGVIVRMEIAVAVAMAVDVAVAVAVASMCMGMGMPILVRMGGRVVVRCGAAVLQHPDHLWVVVHLGQLCRLQPAGVACPLQLLTCTTCKNDSRFP